MLDGYFLWQERLFRALYDKSRATDPAAIDYSMDTTQVSSLTKSWAEAIFSKTLFMFHGTVLGTIFIVMLLLIIASRP